MKLPQHIIKEIFYRTAKACEVVKTSHLFLHRGCCPLCNDHTKRFYLKEYTDHYLVYCHNCGYSHKFEIFLKQNFPDEYKNLRPYVLKSMSDGSAFKRTSFRPQVIKNMSDTEVNAKLSIYLPNVSFNVMDEQENQRHEKYRAYCLKYLIDRRIPESIFKDFLCIHAGPLAGYVGIPFYDKTKSNIIHVQGRLVLARKGQHKQQKYMFIKDEKYGIELENKPIWGTWRIIKDSPTIICEGTLDACAFENSVSTCGATVSEFFINNVIDQFPHRIWCVDNYWTDESGRDLTNRLLERGESCFIIPKDLIDMKDANDLIKKVFKHETYIPLTWINANIYVGKPGLTKLRVQLKSL
jgi:transcription elongation factor Elf1